MIKLHNDERGLVSIVVTAVLMMVISITVLSFATIIRREQREALDNQLSSQAFYAAETGINDVRKLIKTTFAGGVIPVKNDCNNTGSYSTLKPSLSDGVSYSCILVDSTPKELNYQLSTTGGSKVFPITSGNGTPITDIDLRWKSAEPSPGNNCETTSSEDLPKTTEWTCGYGMIRIDLVPVDGLVSRRSLIATTLSAFIAPINTVTAEKIQFFNADPSRSVGLSPVSQAVRGSANCDNDDCKVTITGMPNLPMTSQKYYARVSTIYRDANIFVSARGSGGTSIPLKDAQIMIDSTGRAQDVLRRVQVRVPLNYTGLFAENGLTSTESICKRFTSYNSGYSNGVDSPTCN